MNVVPNWIEELNIHPGDHIIAIVTAEEDFSLLPQYASDGIAKGDVCNVLAASHELHTLRQYMRDYGVAVDEGEQSGQLMFGDPREIGRNETGEFDTQILLENLERFANSLADQGVPHLRSVGNMSWLAGTGNANDGVYLCARLNEIFKGTPISGLWIWDSRQFGGDVIVNVLRTHPKILVKGEVIVNALYMQPADVIAGLGRT